MPVDPCQKRRGILRSLVPKVPGPQRFHPVSWDDAQRVVRCLDEGVVEFERFNDGLLDHLHERAARDGLGYERQEHVADVVVHRRLVRRVERRRLGHSF